MDQVELKQKQIISCELEGKEYSISLPEKAPVGEIIDFCLGLAQYFVNIQIERTKKVAELKEKEIISEEKEDAAD
jgi:hypothetical protein